MISWVEGRETRPAILLGVVGLGTITFAESIALMVGTVLIIIGLSVYAL